jgi:predicted HTH transcriptional regulator
VDQVKKHILENRRMTVCEVANMLGISSGPIQSILKDKLNELDCHNICALQTEEAAAEGDPHQHVPGPSRKT